MAHYTTFTTRETGTFARLQTSPNGSLISVGDIQQKFAYFDEHVLATLGVQLNPHGKMPDVVIYNQSHNTLFLIEAVTSHGPITAQRRSDLAQLFGASQLTLTFVTAFMTRRALAKHVDDIAWETFVWLADVPDHVIHFNGEQLPQSQL